jgi:hypothetical protein
MVFSRQMDAALVEPIGFLLGCSNRMSARLAGAVLLIVLMLIPVLGLFVMLPTGLLALGAGTGVRLGKPPESKA